MWYNTWYYYHDINAIINSQYIKYKWYKIKTIEFYLQSLVCDNENKINNKKKLGEKWIDHYIYIWLKIKF